MFARKAADPVLVENGLEWRSLMENLDVAVPSPRPRFAANQLNRTLRRRWDLLGIVLLVLASIPAAWVLPKTLVLVPNPPARLRGVFGLAVMWPSLTGRYFSGFPACPRGRWVFPREPSMPPGTLYRSGARLCSSGSRCGC